MMKKVSLALAAVVLAGLVCPLAAAIEHPQNVILIGWDGAQREHVEQCLVRKELPSLQRLIGQGKYVRIDVEGTTDTKAGWSQILTGYRPEVTGVYSNGRFQPVPKGLSIFERLENNFGADKFVTVAVIGKKQHCGEINPPQKIRLDDEGKQVNAKPGKKKKKQTDAAATGNSRKQGQKKAKKAGANAQPAPARNRGARSSRRMASSTASFPARRTMECTRPWRSGSSG